MQKIIDKLSACFEQIWEDTQNEILISSFNGKSKGDLTENEYYELLGIVSNNEDVKLALKLQELIEHPELLEDLLRGIEDNKHQEVQNFIDSIINDSKEALILVTRSAALGGKMSSQYQIGKMYMDGVDLVQDYRRAAQWLTESAEQGYADAEYSLGFLYYTGDGVEQNDHLALEWFSKAAKQDVAAAKLLIGLMFAGGEGVPQDDESAVNWFRQAAEQNHAYAQFQLAIMYAEGRGVGKDRDTAREWFTKAAELGLEVADEALKKL